MGSSAKKNLTKECSLQNKQKIKKKKKPRLNTGYNRNSEFPQK